MRILFVSYAFPPGIGGIETVSRLLAAEFVHCGHEVKVVTGVPGPTGHTDGYEVLRDPGVPALVRASRWAEVVFHNNISLSFAWPLLIHPRPWVVAHHTWIRRGWSRPGLAGWLKRFLLRYAKSIAISEAIARDLPGASVIIPDPYDAEVFRVEPNATRDRDLVFVGRLVSDKGADLLLEAVSRLVEAGRRVTLSIVGSGPEQGRLQQRARARGICGSVDFLGSREPDELAGILNRHRILVVPSRWEEPFGIVALEGTACGCVVVGSNGGGLRDAIGDCGSTFVNGDVSALTEALDQMLSHPELVARCRGAAPKHLERHQPRRVAQRYLEEIGAVVPRHVATSTHE